VLKKYTNNNDTIANKHIAASLAEIRTELDDIASSIGGECAEVIERWGTRTLVVRRSVNHGQDVERSDLGRIKPTVERMHQIIHARYQYAKPTKSKAHLQTEEHDRRREEKRVDQLKKNRRDLQEHDRRREEKRVDQLKKNRGRGKKK
jgi:hypothetical protein